MAQKYSGVRTVQHAASGEVNPPTNFTSLGRIFASEPSFQVVAADDGQGYPLYERTDFEWIVDFPDVSKKSAIDALDDGTVRNIAAERIDGSYEVFKDVLVSSLVPGARDGRQIAQMRLSRSVANATSMLSTMSASTGAALGVASGNNVRSGRIAKIHFNIDGGLTDYDFDEIADDFTLGDDSPTVRYSSGRTPALGKRVRFGVTILDRDVYSVLVTPMLADTLLSEFDIEWLDGTQSNFTNVGFTCVPVVPIGVGAFYGTRIDIVAYSDSDADYLTLAPAFV